MAVLVTRDCRGPDDYERVGPDRERSGILTPDGVSWLGPAREGL